MGGALEALQMTGHAEVWAGKFGDEYVERSPGDPAANKEFFRRALAGVDWHDVHGIPTFDSVIEFGAGAGANLEALRALMPYAHLTAVEVNAKAVERAVRWANKAYLTNLLEWDQPAQHTLAFTKGVLIHVPPISLARAYEVLYKSAKRYILLAEYFAPELTPIVYRGQHGLLWKAPHAYQMLDTYADLKLIGYGFVSRRDPHPQDDLNWWLMEKAQ